SCRTKESFNTECTDDPLQAHFFSNGCDGPGDRRVGHGDGPESRAAIERGTASSDRTTALRDPRAAQFDCRAGVPAPAHSSHQFRETYRCARGAWTEP